MPTGLVKFTIQASGFDIANPRGDVENDGDGAQRFREAAGPCRLLADAAALQGPRLVSGARRLTADAQLQEHRVGAHRGIFEARGGFDGAVTARSGKDPRRQAGVTALVLPTEGGFSHRKVTQGNGLLTRPPESAVGGGRLMPTTLPISCKARTSSLVELR